MSYECFDKFEKIFEIGKHLFNKVKIKKWIKIFIKS